MDTLFKSIESLSHKDADLYDKMGPHITKCSKVFKKLRIKLFETRRGYHEINGAGETGIAQIVDQWQAKEDESNDLRKQVEDLNRAIQAQNIELDNITIDRDRKALEIEAFKKDAVQLESIREEKEVCDKQNKQNLSTIESLKTANTQLQMDLDCTEKERNTLALELDKLCKKCIELNNAESTIDVSRKKNENLKTLEGDAAERMRKPKPDFEPGEGYRNIKLEFDKIQDNDTHLAIAYKVLAEQSARNNDRLPLANERRKLYAVNNDLLCQIDRLEDKLSELEAASVSTASELKRYHIGNNELMWQKDQLQDIISEASADTSGLTNELRLLRVVNNDLMLQNDQLEQNLAEIKAEPELTLACMSQNVTQKEQEQTLPIYPQTIWNTVGEAADVNTDDRRWVCDMYIELQTLRDKIAKMESEKNPYVQAFKNKLIALFDPISKPKQSQKRRNTMT